MPSAKLPKTSDADLDALATITPEDIERAQRRWREIASPKFKALLDAEPMPPDAPKK